MIKSVTDFYSLTDEMKSKYIAYSVVRQCEEYELAQLSTLMAR